MKSRTIRSIASQTPPFSRKSALRRSIVAGILITSAMGCTKASSGEDLKTTSKASPSAAETKAPGTVAVNAKPEKQPMEAPTQTIVTEPKTLEEAIAAPGEKKITAVSPSGKTKVIALGKVTLAETETYLLNAVVPADIAIGKETVVSLTLTPKTGWKINQEFPTKLKIEAPSGVTVSAPTQSAKEASKFSEKSAVFKVKFKASDKGVKNFKGKLRFAVCTDATCDPKSAEIAWTLVAK